MSASSFAANCQARDLVLHNKVNEEILEIILYTIMEQHSKKKKHVDASTYVSTNECGRTGPL